MNEINDLSGEFTDDFLHAQADVKRNQQMNAMDNPSGLTASKNAAARAGFAFVRR